MSVSSFRGKDLPESLNDASEAELDALSFGVIGFGADGRVEVYNAFEAAAAGLSKVRVLGRHMFDEVAPCMNNFLVAQRFEDEEVLDEILPYVLTLRMRSTPVQLRLLKRLGGRLCYILVARDSGVGAR
ncbi:MAG: phosphonate transporter [Sphingobacteriales bacterium]|nr:MAG: phosphonate transporter [Sphingobacteriales bacterium]